MSVSAEAVLKLFKQDGPKSPVIFTGERCDVYIPARYRDTYRAVKITAKSIKTLGVFDFVADGQLGGLAIPGVVEIVPSAIRKVVIEGTEYIKLILNKNDTFLTTTEIVMNTLATFPIYKELITMSKPMYSLSYAEKSFLFDRITTIGGFSFPVDHATYEMIIAQITRSKNDIAVPIRNTKGSLEDGVQIAMTDISHAATTTTSKIVGSYLKDGINAALVTENKSPSVIENILRK